MISFLTKECYIFLLYSILIYQSIIINIMRFSCCSVHREPVGGRNCFLGHGVTWGSLNRLLPLPVCSCGISLIHDWHPYLSVRGFSIWIFFTNWWNVNFQTFWKLTFHWMVKKHPLGNKVNKCQRQYWPFKVYILRKIQPRQFWFDLIWFEKICGFVNSSPLLTAVRTL